MENAFHYGIYEALEEHLAKRPPLISDSGYVFLNCRKDPMDKRGVQLIFHRVRKKAGIEKPGLTYLLRQ